MKIAGGKAPGNLSPVMNHSMGDRPILGYFRLAVVMAILGCCVPVGAVGAQDGGAQAIRYAEKMPLADQALVLDATPTNSGAVAVGARGHVLLSEDYHSWRQADSVPTRATLTGVDFVGEEGWAVGHDALILHSADGGVTWERQHFAPEREQPFLDVMFLDSSRGFAIGAYGLFMKTIDGGETWQEEQVSETDDWHLNAITRAESGAIYIAAERGIIYRSEDGGSTWEASGLPYQGSMFDIVSLQEEGILAFGLRGRAFRSVDGGETWQPVETGTESSLHGGRVIPGGSLVIVGGSGVVLERAPGTAEFSQHQHPSDEPLAGVLQGPGGERIYYGVNGIGPAEVVGVEQ